MEQSAPPAPPPDAVYINGLPTDLTEEHLRSLVNVCCSGYPVITCITHVRTRYPGKADRAAALVRFQRADQATWMVENLNGYSMKGLDGAQARSDVRKFRRGISAQPPSRRAHMGDHGATQGAASTQTSSRDATRLDLEHWAAQSATTSAADQTEDGGGRGGSQGACLPPPTPRAMLVK